MLLGESRCVLDDKSNAIEEHSVVTWTRSSQLSNSFHIVFSITNLILIYFILQRYNNSLIWPKFITLNIVIVQFYQTMEYEYVNRI